MKLALPETARGHTIVCDDVRVEISGKLTLVGVYGPGLIVFQEFPVTLPKLCFLVTYSERVDTETGPLVLKIYLPGDPADAPTVNNVFPHEEMRNAPRPELGMKEYAGEKPDPTMQIRLPIEITPVTLKEAGMIRVRMQVGDRLIRMGSIEVMYQEPPEAQAS